MGFWSCFLSPRRRLRTAIILKPSSLFHFVRALKQRNPGCGCPRIAQQIAETFGIDIDKDVVRRVVAAHYRPERADDGPSWLTLLSQAKDSLWSVDLFRTESILLKSHWVLVIMDVFTRRIIAFGVQAVAVDGMALCRMFNQAISIQGLPIRLSLDHDPLFQFHRWQSNLRILGIESLQTVLYVLVSNPFVERLIGTIRREYLDRLFSWNAADLEEKLSRFKDYFNQARVHQGLAGITPNQAAGQPPSPQASLHHHHWKSHCNGLFELPIAA